MTRFLYLGLAYFIITFTLSSCTEKLNDNSLAKIKSQKVIKVGTTGDYKPFTYKGSEGKDYIGIDIDLMRLLAKKFGVKLQIVETSWPRLMEDFKSKKFDIALSGITQTKERELLADFSAPYFKGGKLPFGRCKDSKKFTNLDNLDRPSVKFIVNPGGTNESFTRQFVKKAKIIVHRDNKSVFDEIISGNVDVMISDAIEVDVLTKKHKGVLCKFSDQPFADSIHNIAILLPKNKELKRFVDNWLRDLKRTGDLKSILAKNTDHFSK